MLGMDFAMGFRFKKSINLGGGTRLNISKSGIGASTGIKGARIGIGPKGVRKTASIPGTGISHVKESRFKSQDKLAAGGRGWIVGIIIGLICAAISPPLGIVIILASVAVHFLFKGKQQDEVSEE